MSSNIDCPICMEEIDGVNNRVTTECGHAFHTKCLMTNASRNGFGCPYCRTKLAQEEPSGDEEEEDDDYNPFFDDDYEDEAEEITDDTLMAMRNLFLVAEGEEPEPVEESESESDDSDIEIVINIEPREQTRPLTQSKPSPAFIARMLTASGVTMEDMVKCLIQETCHEEYAEEDYQRDSSVMFGKIRRIISRHQRGIEAE